jgi:hypothetical protein
MHQPKMCKRNNKKHLQKLRIQRKVWELHNINPSCWVLNPKTKAREGLILYNKLNKTTTTKKTCG